ncbi:hypothetical protein ACFOHS_18880 [Jhaorihella thermophila]
MVRETSRAATAETPGLMFALWRWAHSFVCATSLMVIIAVWLWLSMTDETGNGIAAANFIALILIPPHLALKPARGDAAGSRP